MGLASAPAPKRRADVHFGRMGSRVYLIVFLNFVSAYFLSAPLCAPPQRSIYLRRLAAGPTPPRAAVRGWSGLSRTHRESVVVFTVGEDPMRRHLQFAPDSEAVSESEEDEPHNDVVK